MFKNKISLPYYVIHSIGLITMYIYTFLKGTVDPTGFLVSFLFGMLVGSFYSLLLQNMNSKDEEITFTVRDRVINNEPIA